MRDGEEILRVEVEGARELAADPAPEEVTLEVGVVRDDRAPGEQRAQLPAHEVERRRCGSHRVADPGQAHDRGRDRGARIHERLDAAHGAGARIEQQRADLEDARARVAGQPGGLEVDHRDRPDPREPRRKRRDVEICDRYAQRFVRRRSRPCTADLGGS
jgi:hypothetical protein